MNKQLRDLEIKSVDKGEVAAVFSTFEVIDADKDVTKSGAFTENAPVRISAYGHGSWRDHLPVGRGVIKTTPTEAVLQGRFFLDTTPGRDTFNTIKEMGDLQEWSYSVDARKVSFGEFAGEKVRFLEEVHVDEISPVLIGAGVGTRTLGIKNHPDKYLEHAASVIADIGALIERTEDVIASRVSQGKSRMAERSVELLAMLDGDLIRLKSLLEPENEPLPDELADAAWREYSRFLQLTGVKQ